MSWQTRAKIYFILASCKIQRSRIVKVSTKLGLPALITILVWAGFLFLCGEAVTAFALAGLAGFASLRST